MASRRRRRAVRLTPLGYIVLSIMIIVLLVGIYFIIWSISGGSRKTEQQDMVSNSITVTPTPSLAPMGTPTATIPPTSTPTTAPSIAPTTPTATPKPDDTPQPGVKTPSPAQVQSALDGKLTSKLNLRKGPGTQYDILGTYSTGSRVKVYARENDFYFVMVVKENKYGYMSAEYIEKTGLLPGETASPSPEPPSGVVTGKVRASTLALRSGPSKDSKAVGQAVSGDVVYIYFKTGDFYYMKIVSTGLKCYGYAEYVTPEGDVPSGTPVPE